MTSARRTPHYSRIIDSEPMAPVAPPAGSGPQLVAERSVVHVPDETRTGSVGRAPRVLSLLGRRSGTAPEGFAPAPVAPVVSVPASGRKRHRVVPIAQRPWRVLIVSAVPGATPRSFEVSRWQARATIGAIGLVATLAVAFVGALGAAVRTPGIFGQGEVQALEAELAATRDSLDWERAPETGALGSEEDSPAGSSGASASAPPSDATPATPVPTVPARVAAPAAAAPAPVSAAKPASAPRIIREMASADPVLRTGGLLSVVPRSLSDLPVIGAMVSGFSHARRHPLLHRVRPHLGVDLAAPRGTRVSAPAPGVVSFVGHRMGFGLVVELDHGAGVVTRYAHLRSSAVQTGETVRRGEAIAAVGTSGVTTGPHLHYEVMVNGRQVDPLRVRFGRADSSAASGPVLAGHPVSASPVAGSAAVSAAALHEGTGSSPTPPPR